MRTIAFLVATAVLVAPSRSGAQSKPTGGTIAGIVVDDSGRPIADADVFAFPQTPRVHTDSAGRFALTNLDGDFYHVRARHIGFAPGETTTDLSKNGRVEVKIELARRPVVLDSVVVTADGVCPTNSYKGFNCRKHSGKGVYLTDDDLADKGAVELGEAFRDVPGFRLEIAITPYGRKPKPIPTRGSGCLNALVNGLATGVTNPLPLFATELLAAEIYSRPSEVPSEYQRFIWQRGIRQSSSHMSRDNGSEPCSLVVYWTSYR
ncbi:MAG TPA: carboxypeptidase regulatory-like domain-containing protein [Gemmatimonadaceae bacterium]|nr:carboxypeptidase regulatory-like domain-containing protein [Gemmatimonadaceae bacterium]